MWCRWDLEQFRKEKLHIWTRDGYVFEGEEQSNSQHHRHGSANSLL
jgi:hypothetical protein